MIRWILIATTATIALAVGFGCGGDDDQGGESADQNRAARDIQPESQKRAESLVLQLSDFPDGWRASPSGNEAESINECLQVDYSDLTITGEADSDDFATGDIKEVSSSAAVFASDQEAEDGLSDLAEAMGTQAAEDCFTERIEEGFAEDDSAEGVELGEIDVGELSFTPPANVEDGRAWEVVIPFEVTSGAFEGASETLSLEFVILREGDAATNLVAVQLDAAERDQLLDVIADRMTESTN